MSSAIADPNPSSPFWVPFQWNWAEPERWRTEFPRSPRAVTHALSGLRRVFNDRVIFGRSWVGHQFAFDYMMRLSRWRILEMGITLADLPVLGDYRDRLAGSPESYMGAAAEFFPRSKTKLATESS
jgi:hypothetical protein